MISCKKATTLISKAMEERLSLKEEFELKVHLFICEFCEAFKNQSNLLRQAIKRLKEEDSQDSKPENIICDTGPAKEKLKKKLKDHSL